MAKPEKVIKYVASVFAFVILATIITLGLFRNSLEEVQFNKGLKDVNNGLPLQVGRIGSLDKISFKDKTVIYEMSVHSDSRILNLYSKHYEDFKEMFKYSIMTLNGHNNNGNQLADYYSSRDIDIRVIISDNNGESKTWNISNEEQQAFLQKYQLSPTSALHKVIDMQIEVMKLDLPFGGEDTSPYESVYANAMTLLMEDGIILKNIEHINNDIIFEYLVDENNNEFDLELVEIISQTIDSIEEFAMILAEDPDMLAFYNVLAIAKSNLIIRYRSVQTKKSSEIKIPYMILRKYSHWKL